MTGIDLVSQRIFHQRIGAAKAENPADVVRWMGALQAQEYNQGVWAVGLRTASAVLADVEQAIDAGNIIRTWPMRGTLHFIPPADAKWMLSISAGRMLAADRRRQEQLQLDTSILERCKQIFSDALQGGRRLSRPGMMQLLEDAGISTANQRGYHILFYAALTGLICLGPLQSGQQTFVLLDEWAPDAPVLPRPEALGRLAVRYFTSHGPAGLRDFAWWAGLTLGDARAAIGAAGAQLVSDTFAGQEAWWSAGSLPAPRLDPEEVHLLAGYDEYLLGYNDRSAMLPKDYADRLAPSGNGVFKPILLLGGQIAGVWQRTIKKGALELQVHPFGAPSFSPDRLDAAARRYADFLGLPLSSLTVHPGPLPEG